MGGEGVAGLYWAEPDYLSPARHPFCRSISYFLQPSRNAKLLLGLLAGLSLSILATGYLLRKRRRRYRAISTTSSDYVPSSSSSSLQRASTFRMNGTPTPCHSMTGEFPGEKTLGLSLVGYLGGGYLPGYAGYLPGCGSYLPGYGGYLPGSGSTSVY